MGTDRTNGGFGPLKVQKCLQGVTLGRGKVKKKRRNSGSFLETLPVGESWSDSGHKEFPTTLNNREREVKDLKSRAVSGEKTVLNNRKKFTLGGGSGPLDIHYQLGLRSTTSRVGI